MDYEQYALPRDILIKYANKYGVKINANVLSYVQNLGQKKSPSYRFLLKSWKNMIKYYKLFVSPHPLTIEFARDYLYIYKHANFISAKLP